MRKLLGRIAVDTRGLRESRDFRLLTIGSVVTGLGTQAALVALPYQVYVTTGSAFLTGLLGGLGVAGTPVVGVEQTNARLSAIPAYASRGLSTVDDVDQRCRVGPNLGEALARPGCRLVGQTPRSVLAVAEHVAVGVEDVVDNLEEEP